MKSTPARATRSTIFICSKLRLPSLETCVQLAAILKVSTDELLLGREPRSADLEISDVRLLDKFQRLQELDKRDREAVIILIDGVLARRAVESAIASAR
jgi:hypothetical protein